MLSKGVDERGTHSVFTGVRHYVVWYVLCNETENV